MKLIQTNQLTQDQKNDLHDLILLCQKKEPLTLTFPEEADTKYFLLYQDKQIISALSCLFSDMSCCECIAMTAPSMRRQGLFYQLLDAAFEYLDQYESDRQVEADVFFLTDHTSTDALHTLVALGAEYCYSEYIMELPLLQVDLTVTPSDITLICPSKHQFDAVLNNTTIGSCRLQLSLNAAFLYDFKILEQYRRQGYGSAFLQCILGHLRQQNLPAVQLQVSSLNVPAVSLYRKFGFHPIETLSYFHFI